MKAKFCEVCGRQFSEAEWRDAHEDEDGDPVHETCCMERGLCSEGGHE